MIIYTPGGGYTIKSPSTVLLEGVDSLILRIWGDDEDGSRVSVMLASEDVQTIIDIFPSQYSVMNKKLDRIIELLEARAKKMDFVLCGGDIVDAISTIDGTFTIKADPTITTATPPSTPT